MTKSFCDNIDCHSRYGGRLIKNSTGYHCCYIISEEHLQKKMIPCMYIDWKGMLYRPSENSIRESKSLGIYKDLFTLFVTFEKHKKEMRNGNV